MRGHRLTRRVTASPNPFVSGGKRWIPNHQVLLMAESMLVCALLFMPL